MYFLGLFELEVRRRVVAKVPNYEFSFLSCFISIVTKVTESGIPSHPNAQKEVATPTMVSGHFLVAMTPGFTTTSRF